MYNNRRRSCTQQATGTEKEIVNETGYLKLSRFLNENIINRKNKIAYEIRIFKKSAESEPEIVKEL